MKASSRPPGFRSHLVARYPFAYHDGRSKNADPEIATYKNGLAPGFLFAVRFDMHRVSDMFFKGNFH